MDDILKKIFDYSLEDIMGLRFGRYSKTIIQDRALPDVRDGLKPVQRRILYAMHQDRNTHEKPYKKSAKTVGNVMGFYHPHGDSSIYEAMVRMSQWWKQNAVFIDMHGNNGSMDGDSAAAMRYTEARLAKISNEMLKDISKDTVDLTFNYDDSMLEPTVLPAKFPNLLVNGSTGISAGYATNIPPHNLSEVIEATIKRIDSPNCYLETILEIIKGPDFPTGAIIEGKQGIEEAYKTGRGKIFLKAKYEITKKQIIITELPYDVNKANLVKRIDEIRLDKKIEGISEVRDESDLENPQTIVIDLKKDAQSELIINYLLKNTDLQISYNFNMVAIVNNRPMTLGILPILDAYINHFKDVVVRRTSFDLEHAKQRQHIVEGLIRALSILDEVVATIRASKDKGDAKNNLVEKYQFTEKQAEQIVMLQLYKLTNTDVTLLISEKEELETLIKALELILNDENVLKNKMKDELRQIKKEYGNERKSMINDEITEIKIDTTSMIPKEDCIVVITKQGYVKRVSKRSFMANDEDTMVKEKDYAIGLYELNTLDTVLMFTDLGNYIYIPVYEIPELKWKELGKHISNIIKIESDENIINCMPVTNFDHNIYITSYSKNGLVKRTILSEFKVTRYSKAMTFMKLKDADKVVAVNYNEGKEVLITTKNGYALRYDIEEITPIGLKGSGVKAISLKEDQVISAHTINENDYIIVITENKTGKRIKLSEFEKTSRAKKGIQLVRDVKTNPYRILKTFITTNKNIGIISDNIEMIKVTDLPIVDRYSTGTIISKQKINDAFIRTSLEVVKNITVDTVPEIEEITLDEVDKKILTIDDFLEEINID